MSPRRLAVLVLPLALLAAGSAHAQTQRIAYVDMQRALGEIEEGKIATARLKKQFDQKQAELNKKQEELERDYASLQAAAREGVLKADKLREKEAELERKKMEAAKLWQESQKFVSEEERKLTQEIFAKMVVVIRGMAESEGFTYVFDKREAGLLYAPDALELTNELVRKYNAKFGAGAAKAAPGKK